MSHIELKNITINGINMYDKRRKLWNIFSSNKPKPIRILKDMNFSAKNGDRIGILGKNGHGKSSLVKAITGIYPPHLGTININGKIISVIEGGSVISAQVPARYALKMCFVYNNAVDEYNEDLANQIFDFAGLNEYKEMPLIQYSSGMVNRLSVSASLFQSGKIAIFDEVLTMTDANFNRKARLKIDEIWRNVDIGIYISHNIEDLRKFCDKCYIVHEGSMLDCGKTEKMIDIYNKL